MNIKSITVIVEPVSPGASVSMVHDGRPVSNPWSVHQFENYTKLVDELEKQTSANVTLVEAFLQVALPASGIIILYPQCRGLSFGEILAVHEPGLRETLSQRLVLLNVVRGEAYKLLSQYCLAAVVEDFDYRYWWNLEQRSHPQQALHGLISAAKGMGRAFRREQGQHCYISGKKSERLPALLVRYLEAYAQVVPGVKPYL